MRPIVCIENTGLDHSRNRTSIWARGQSQPSAIACLKIKTSTSLLLWVRFSKFSLFSARYIASLPFLILISCLSFRVLTSISCRSSSPCPRLSGSWISRSGFTSTPLALYFLASSSRFFNPSFSTISSVLFASSVFIFWALPFRITFLKSSLRITAFFIISSAFTSLISILTISSGFCITGVADTSIVRSGLIAKMRFCEVSAWAWKWLSSMIKIIFLPASRVLSITLDRLLSCSLSRIYILPSCLILSQLKNKTSFSSIWRSFRSSK